MAEEKNNRKSIANRLTYTYIRKIKKWMFCPACQHGKMTIDKKSTTWTCEVCEYKLSANAFDDDYVFWFCDECNAYLNNQEGFDRQVARHICRNCGYQNDTILENIKGICSDCGKIIPDPETTLCADCREARRQKAKEWLTTAGKVVGVVAAVVGAAYLASQATDDDNSNYMPLPDKNGNDEGGSTMSKYKVIIDGEKQDEVFDTEAAAEEYAMYLCSCSRTGAETLHWSNPGDYDYNEDTFEAPEYEIVKEG